MYIFMELVKMWFLYFYYNDVALSVSKIYSTIKKIVCLSNE